MKKILSDITQKGGKITVLKKLKTQNNNYKNVLKLFGLLFFLNDVKRNLPRGTLGFVKKVVQFKFSIVKHRINL